MRRLTPILAVILGLLVVAAESQAVTSKTTRFVAGFEGFVSCPYADPAGHATIGYGHLLHYGPPTKADREKWGCISKARGLRILRRDLQETEDQVFDRIGKARVTAPIVTALTSFAFNLGAGYLDYVAKRGKRPATHIARAIRRGKYWRAARQMLHFDGVIVNGKRYELKGLQIRRRKEYRMMATGIRQLKSCSGTCAGNSTGKGGSGGGLGVG